MMTTDSSQKPTLDIQVVKKLSSSKYPVFLGIDVQTKESIAFKTFPSNDPRYKKEKSILQKLNHPHIVKFRDTIEDVPYDNNQTKSFLGLEYASHGDLLEIILNYGRLPEVLARTLFHQLIDAVSYLHEENIAHLDLKTDNLIIDDDLNLRLIDFESAQELDSLKLESRGSPGYRAPEVKQGQAQDFGAADVYAAGVVLFVMMSGSFPYGEVQKGNRSDFDGYYLAMRKQNTKFWEAHSKQRGSSTFYSMNFKRLINGMLEEDPAKRATIEDIKNCEWFKGPVIEREKLKTEMKKFLFRRPSSMDVREKLFFC